VPPYTPTANPRRGTRADVPVYVWIIKSLRATVASASATARRCRNLCGSDRLLPTGPIGRRTALPASPTGTPATAIQARTYGPGFAYRSRALYHSRAKSTIAPGRDRTTFGVEFMWC